jgi:RNA polymerase sigma-32 factor
MSYDYETKRYYSYIRHYKILTPTEQLRLLEEYKLNGNRDILNELVKANIRLVIKIVSQYNTPENKNISNADLIQEGCMGLVTAIEKYDSSKSPHLSAYAYSWIRAKIRLFIMRNIKQVVLGKTQGQRKLFGSLNKLVCEFDVTSSTNKQSLSLSKFIAENTGVEESEAIEIYNLLTKTDISLNSELNEYDNDDRCFSDVITSDVDVEQIVSDKMDRELVEDVLNKFISTLDERDRDILSSRILSQNDRGDTLQLLGDRYKISKERVRQLEKRVKKSLTLFIRRGGRVFT